MWPFKRRYVLSVFPDAVGFRFHAKAANGEILFQSESYTRREDAERAAVALTKAKLVLV